MSRHFLTVAWGFFFVFAVISLARAQETAAPAAPTGVIDPNSVVIRTHLTPTDGAMLGQQVQFFSDVLWQGEMPHPPQVEAPKIDGAEVFRFESQATTMSDQIEGKSYVGQRFEFAIYGRRAGSLTVPATSI